MQTLQISKGKIAETVVVPRSKSHANRALILSALREQEITLEGLPEASDVTQLVAALRQIGLEIQVDGSSAAIRNHFPACETDATEIDVGEGGTTARFLAALLLLGKKSYQMKLGKRLAQRPWEEFLALAESLGAKVSLKGTSLLLRGPIRRPTRLEVDCARTTQFATAFDLILPETKVIPVSLTSSQSYWEMNAAIKAQLRTQDRYEIPRDWSSAAFPMVFAALNHPVHFPGLVHDPDQADAKLFHILSDLGALSSDSGGIIVSPMTNPKAIRMSMHDCLDLFPALVFLAAHMEGVHEFSGLENLEHKESQRLHEVCKLLDQFDRSYEVKDHQLRLVGSAALCGPRVLRLPDDHRIVMMAALLLRHHRGGELDHPTSVNKSYPGFFELMRS